MLFSLFDSRVEILVSYFFHGRLRVCFLLFLNLTLFLGRKRVFFLFFLNRFFFLVDKIFLFLNSHPWAIFNLSLIWWNICIKPANSKPCGKCAGHREWGESEIIQNFSLLKNWHALIMKYICLFVYKCSDSCMDV